jgi:hypothetical protein
MQPLQPEYLRTKFSLRLSEYRSTQLVSGLLRLPPLLHVTHTLVVVFAGLCTLMTSRIVSCNTPPAEGVCPARPQMLLTLNSSLIFEWYVEDAPLCRRVWVAGAFSAVLPGVLNCNTHWMRCALVVLSVHWSQWVTSTTLFVCCCLLMLASLSSMLGSGIVSRLSTQSLHHCIMRATWCSDATSLALMHVTPESGVQVHMSYMTEVTHIEH